MRKYSLNYSDEVYNYLYNNSELYTIKELVKILKEKFNFEIEKKKLAQYCIKMKLKYKYEKPKKSHSNIPTRVGTIVNKTDGNYLKIKTGKHKWEYLQRYIYQKKNNVKLKDNEYVIFLNQNRRDFSKNNLKVISRRSSAIMSKDELFSSDSEITKLGILNSKLKIKIKEVYDE